MINSRPGADVKGAPNQNNHSTKLNNPYGYKIGDCFKVYLPEYKSSHSPFRAVVITDVDYNNNAAFIVPFSRYEDYDQLNLTRIRTLYNVDPIRNVREFGGRDLDGYIIPRLHGWLNVRRLVEKFGTFSDSLYEVILEDYERTCDRYPLIHTYN